MINLSKTEMMNICKRYRDGTALPLIADADEIDRVHLFNHRNENRQLWQEIDELCQTRDDRLFEQTSYKASLPPEHKARDRVRAGLILQFLRRNKIIGVSNRRLIYPSREFIISHLETWIKRRDDLERKPSTADGLTLVANLKIADVDATTVDEMIDHFNQLWGLIIPSEPTDKKEQPSMKEELTDLEILKRQFGHILCSYILVGTRKVLAGALVEQSRKDANPAVHISSTEQAEMLITAFEDDVGLTLC